MKVRTFVAITDHGYISVERNLLNRQKTGEREKAEQRELERTVDLFTWTNLKLINRNVLIFFHFIKNSRCFLKNPEFLFRLNY